MSSNASTKRRERQSCVRAVVPYGRPVPWVMLSRPVAVVAICATLAACGGNHTAVPVLSSCPTANVLSTAIGRRDLILANSHTSPVGTLCNYTMRQFALKPNDTRAFGVHLIGLTAEARQAERATIGDPIADRRATTVGKIDGVPVVVLPGGRTVATEIPSYLGGSIYVGYTISATEAHLTKAGYFHQIRAIVKTLEDR